MYNGIGPGIVGMISNNIRNGSGGVSDDSDVNPNPFWLIVSWLAIILSFINYFFLAEIFLEIMSDGRFTEYRNLTHKLAQGVFGLTIFEITILFIIGLLITFFNWLFKGTVELFKK